MDAHLRAIFAAEAETLLGRMAQETLALEASGPDAGRIDQLFRDAHTIKGSAALVGLPEAGAVAHVLEDVLGDLRSGRRPVTPRVIDVVLRGIDDLRDVVTASLEDGAPVPLVAPAIARLRARGEPPLEEHDTAPAHEDVAGDPHARDAAARDARAHEEAADRGDGDVAEAGDDRGRDTTVPADAADGTDEGDTGGSGDAMAAAPGSRDTGQAKEERGATWRPGEPHEPDELVRVSRRRLDRLVALAGQAVAGGLRLRHQVAPALAVDPDAAAESARLERLLRTLQNETVAARMTTPAAIAEPLHRAVRDVARDQGRKAVFVLDADTAELDRSVLDALRDPLLHLVRNAVGHGLEPPADRAAAGKDETGTVTLRARRAGGEVVVEVGDDGRGLDLDALRRRAGAPDADDAVAAQLAFRPGLSTAAEVTDLAGRGVGLDAVRQAVHALRGRVEVRSVPGHGTTFVLRVPFSLAVLPCVVVGLGDERYALPAHSAIAVVEAQQDARVALEGGSALWVGGELVSVSSLAGALGLPASEKGPAVVLTGSGAHRHAFRVTELLGQRALTVGELGGVLPPLPLIAGASIEPDGSVILVLDPAALVAAATGARAPASAGPADGGPRATRILVVDDAMTVRELQRSILERAGYDVEVASDGQEALERLDRARPDLVVTDLEMPRLDGLGLVGAVRSRPGLQGLPVLVVSSRAEERDRARALQAGADAYIVKRDFDEDALLAAIRELLRDPS